MGLGPLVPTFEIGRKRVFSVQEIAHFRAFGFVILRRLLSPHEVAQLTEEVRSSLTAAFGGLGTDRDPDGTGGIRGDYLPLTVDEAPLSQRLIADDPRLYQGSVALAGDMTVPTPPIATCLTSNAGWHSDDGTGVGGVKLLAYLEPRGPGNGGLRVIPGSHAPGFSERVARYWAEDPGRQGFEPWPMPHVALDTEPADVIAFDRHLFHSSAGGSDRLAWSIEYLPWPGLGDRDRLRLLREMVLEAADYSHQGYDRLRWPVWDHWVRAARDMPSRQTALQRLELAGVFDPEAG